MISPADPRNASAPEHEAGAPGPDPGAPRLHAPGDELCLEPVRRGIEPLIFEKGRPGHRGLDLPASGWEGAGEAQAALDELLPQVSLRRKAPRLPEVAEPEVIRHYTRLSHLNHAVDLGIYPLGSCTMKYNPKLNDELAALPGFADLHPYQDEEEVQGILELMWRLERALCQITGLSRLSLQPAAGAAGELVGILMIRAYHRSRGDTQRDTILVPDSAHGTNLASASMAGYKVQELPSSDRGLIDVAGLRHALSHRTAGLMLTNPNTLGLFEVDICQISGLVHEAGGLVYYDGANLNAILGRCRPGDMGMDVVHLNPHKTFSTPHGGGGPGAGPVAVGPLLEPFLPVPLVEKAAARAAGGGPSTEAVFRLDYERPRSIGRVKGYYGNIGVAIRAYAYILRMGAEGLRQASGDAVLNANYLRARLHDLYRVPFDRTCMHEFVASALRQKARGVLARDIAKRILDFGMHAPTVYFPLNVPEALMVEPTESESLDSLDAFVEVMRRIDQESRDNPALVTQAPHNTPVRRPDETLAARRPVLRWEPPGDEAPRE